LPDNLPDPERAELCRTHEVENQATPLLNYNVFTSNTALLEAVKREGADWAVADLTKFGEYLGRAETIELGALANRNPPILKTFDRYGNRIDEVEFHPAWHELMAASVGQGIHSSSWAEPKRGAHIARAAAAFMFTEIEAGTQCPITMTHASVLPLRKNKELAQVWLPKLFTRTYDRRFIPVAGKKGALIGMGMTEKQGGSDVRTNKSQASLLNAQTGEYSIVGHKWFFSAPMCDAFLVLAQAKAGLSCFFMPRFLPDGSLNSIRIQRLKDKLGNKSNASSEVEFFGAHAWLIGEEGRGVQTIIEMATYTRLDCGLGSAGLMHQALVQAIHHASMRTAFQRKLIDQPLMRNVLADLALEVEAVTLLIMRTVRAFDAQEDEREAHFRRIVTPAAKYFICKRAPSMGVEAMEVLGGNGYVEEGNLARIYREMPLNSIWEGSGNVMCLDLMRALSKTSGKTSEGLAVVQEEWRAVKGNNAILDRFAKQLENDIASATEQGARRLTESLAKCISAALLVQHAPSAMADLYCASRLDGNWGNAFGTLPESDQFLAIIDRAWSEKALVAIRP
jgi:putative acyl-CoA dehydrogenase